MSVFLRSRNLCEYFFFGTSHKVTRLKNLLVQCESNGMREEDNFES